MTASSKSHYFQKLKFGISQISYIPKILKIVWISTRGWTLAWLILILIQGLLPAILIYFIRSLVNSLVKTIENEGNWENLQVTVYIGLAMVGLMVLMEFVKECTTWIKRLQTEHLKDYLKELIQQKSVSVDLEFYDSPKYYDMLLRAREQANDKSSRLLDDCGNLIQGTVSLAAMSAMLIQYGLWLPLALLASTLPAVYVTLSHAGKFYNWWNSTTEKRRRANYCDQILSSSDVAGEIRIFDLGEHFQNQYRTIRHQLRKDQINLGKNESIAKFAASTLVALISSGCLGWMGWKAIKGIFTLGDVALFYQAFKKGQQLLRTLLNGMTDAYSNILYLGMLFKFLKLETRISDPSNSSALPFSISESIKF